MRTVTWSTWSSSVERWNRLSPLERSQRAAICAQEGHVWVRCEGLGSFCNRCMAQDLDAEVAAA